MDDLGVADPVGGASPLLRFLDEPVAVPKAAAQGVRDLRGALDDARADGLPPAGQLERIRTFLEPVVARRYDAAVARIHDLEQLELLASEARSRAEFLADLTLDPPSSTSDLAGPPSLDEDFLVLSTIHSAKGLEWDVVHLIHAADGMIPSDMATGDDDELEEERRLLYVALTRARDALHVTYPQRYYRRPRGLEDPHARSQRSRFLPDEVLEHFDVRGPEQLELPEAEDAIGGVAEVDAFLAGLWAD
jgi:DNA helicase-2/ATP-dependent DNA helicase PcrA